MAIVNRASLPEEFFDVTSSRMLLQPEPQYFFGLLGKMALGAAISIAAGMGNGGITADRGIPSTGAQVSQAGAQLMLASADPMTAQAIQMVAELGKAPGHTVRLNRPRFGSGGFTLASREIASGAAVSLVGIDLGSEQVTVTLKRYGGPYDAVNGNVAPFVIDKFDASLGLHSLMQYVGVHMQRDFDKWFDAVFATLFASGSTTLWPQGISSDATSQIAGDMPGDVDILFRGVETLKNGLIPRFPNGNYRATISPTFARQLKADPQAAQYIRYSPSDNPVNGANGVYLGQVSGCDIFEASTLVSTNNAQSVPVTTSVMFGPGMIGCGTGQLPTVAYSTDDNYGFHSKLIWWSLLGFTLQDARFGVQMHTS